MCVIILGCPRHIVRDVVFVIDTSSSIGFSRFQLVRELAENITITLKLNSPETLFGLITFDTFAQFEFNISKHTDLSTLLPAINPGLPYYSGFGTNTSSALSLLLSGSVEGGFLQLRENTSKVAIVITDSISHRLPSLQSAENSLHATNIFDIYAVGITDNSYYWNFRPMAGNPFYYSFTRIFTSRSAQQLKEDIIELLCSSK